MSISIGWKILCLNIFESTELMDNIISGLSVFSSPNTLHRGKCVLAIFWREPKLHKINDEFLHFLKHYLCMIHQQFPWIIIDRWITCEYKIIQAFEYNFSCFVFSRENSSACHFILDGKWVKIYKNLCETRP